MFNPFVIRKWATIALCGFLPTIAWHVGMTWYTLWIALGAFFVSLLVCFAAGGKLLANPFTQLLEGRGLLALDMSSAGIIRPFIVSVQQPFIKGKFNGEDIEDIFNRETVMQLGNPETKGKGYILQGTKKTGEKVGGLAVVLTEEEYNSARFALFHYPVLIFNSQLKTFLTKDMLMAAEKEVFSEHLLLYMNRKIEELTSLIRDFARYIVELTKPKGSIFANKWVIVIMIILGLLLLAAFAPAIIDTLKGGVLSSAGDALPNQPVSVI